MHLGIFLQLIRSCSDKKSHTTFVLLYKFIFVQMTSCIIVFRKSPKFHFSQVLLLLHSFLRPMFYMSLEQMMELKMFKGDKIRNMISIFGVTRFFYSSQSTRYIIEISNINMGITNNKIIFRTYL